MDPIKLKIKFDMNVCNSKIKHLHYYDNFTNICADNTYTFPKHVTCITFAHELKTKESFLKKKVKIPRTVTTLTINYSGYLNRLIIPPSVTCLNFGHFYGNSIWSEFKSLAGDLDPWESINNYEKCYKCGNKALHRGDVCGYITRDRIPDGITHLSFGKTFNRAIKGCVPDSVTYLTIYYGYLQFNNIPPSITHLTIRNDNNGPPSVSGFSQIIADGIAKSFENLIYVTIEYSNSIHKYHRIGSDMIKF